ncbi:DUF4350 domain-containing protein [Psychroserpens mesophilus]|uniref:DUF4350 domain-containing protein n=1 Tax=Psychroserpens mesophilus TaxID=325473 RepID=UPI00058C173C|nr:DUF4350 domain-containing protein [Psychroserpens mesophilus]
MSKKVKFYIVLTAVAIFGIVLMEYSKPKQVNWFTSYAKHHKIPFGTYVFNEQLERLFSHSEIINLETPPYLNLSQTDSINGTYVFINNTIQFGNTELDRLLDWTSKGNTLFIASEDFEDQLLDTLNLDIDIISIFEVEGDTFQFQLSNHLLDTTTVAFDRTKYVSHFNKIDTLNTKIISTVKGFKFDEEAEDSTITETPINFIRQPFGDGTIYLSTFPQAFTNYFILNSPNQNYTAGIMSYIDQSKPIYVDHYYKSGKSYYTSPMYIMLNNKALKWAYYIMLIGVVIYIIFEGKRKQRAIPIVKPLRNQTLDFTRTIANMYYEKGKHYEIAQHKIQHFLEYIRTHLHLSTTIIDDEFLKNLAARSNNSVDDTKHLFTTIAEFDKNTRLNNIQLERLNELIETFKSNNSWKKKT